MNNINTFTNFISGIGLLTYKSRAENKKNTKNFDHFTGIVNSNFGIKIRDLDEKELNDVKRFYLLERYGDKFEFDEPILPGLNCSSEVQKALMSRYDTEKKMTPKTAKKLRTEDNLAQNEIDETVKKYGGTVVKHYNQNTGKLASIIKLSDSTALGICAGYSTKQLIALSEGKTIDRDMRVVNKNDKKSKLKISEVNKICHLQAEGDEIFLKNPDFKFDDQVLEKNNFSIIDFIDISKKDDEERHVFALRVADSIISNKNKKNIYERIALETKNAAHDISIMIENQKNKKKVIFSDPNHRLFTFYHEEDFKAWFIYFCLNHYWY
ncbi:YopT-type cysteine protease domain-containing protein [Candidatus Williamhamiltonella defendens]|uniref:YopT-type cysteine protease domain-containing protein n=1 Tax=Candidatus Williamhamiltonella defendens TaxID=138072 RepID=UPI0015825B55|nr:YopT-type cysteine protease domain-containing protein [Candidatus Hamiltonella defensa]